MAKIVVIGGSISGLLASISLSRQGHEVKIVDPTASDTDLDLEKRFSSRQKGLAQRHHSHAFLAKLRNNLKSNYPDVLDALLKAGAFEMPFMEFLPKTILQRDLEPGDVDLVGIGARRTTFETVILGIAQKEQGIEIIAGEISTLLASKNTDNPTRIYGVKIANGDEILGDLIIDCSGRNSERNGWLKKLGLGEETIEESPCPIQYLTRFYKLPSSASFLEPDGRFAGDFGYIKVGIFPADNGFFSITVGLNDQDRQLGKLRNPEAFDNAMLAFEHTGKWLRIKDMEPFTKVEAMTKLKNRRRKAVPLDQGGSIVGLIALGDSLMHTNPLYGRGCTISSMQAFELPKIIDSSNDGSQLVENWNAYVEKEIFPYYDMAVFQDAQDFMTIENGGIPPKGSLGHVIKEGVIPATYVDTGVYRAFIKAFNLIGGPFDLLSDPNVLDTINKTIAQRESNTWELPDPFGPTRDELVRLIENSL
ncbi:MAG: hypothetical protein HKL80_00790 [Acidimicrobiales bacterium]|nr:hypothetical protein [Acidimicrobiales bacterium]